MKTSRSYVCLGLFMVFSLLTGLKSFEQLKADFISNVQSGCTPLIAAFQDISTGQPASWSWNLGNGVMSSAQNPVTTYFDPGIYTVKLVIKNATGKDSVTKISYITVYEKPQVDFNATPTQGCFPLSVKLTNKSKAGSGTISEYLWDFGDGNVGTKADTVYTYTTSGTFDVTLKVTNNYGCYNAITKSDFVVIDNGVNANFDLASLNVCKTPATATFKNSSDGSGDLKYTWNFGDGSTSTDESPVHNYNSSGNYNVLLTVISSSGCSDTANMPLVVNFPASSFTHTTAACLKQTIRFTNTSVPKPVSCKWYFGDGTTSTLLNPDKIFSQTGNYSVKLVNIFSSNCSDSVTNTINIASGPAAAFTADDTVKCAAPLTVNFSNKTTGTATEFFWDFGDGKTSTAQNPSNTYTRQGLFTVKLTATNVNGCQDVFQKQNFISIQQVKIINLKGLPDSSCVPFDIKPSVILNMNVPVKKYTWDFGDGSFSNSSMPVHTYTKDGVFSVKATIETMDGCSDTHTGIVLAGHKPKASFTTIRDSVCINQTQEFISTSTKGPITFLSWDNGPLLDSASGSHYFKNPSDTGYMPTKLAVYNYGCVDSIVLDSSIYVMPPIAKMQFTMHCDDKQRVDFTDASVADLVHTWNFGDGKTDNTKTPSHVYASPGNYTVNLYTVNKACKDTATVNIHVINEVGTISIPGSVYCRGNTITTDLTGINIDNIKNTTWDFGDGTITTINGATKTNHIYLMIGKFKIKASLTDKNNCEYSYESKDSVTVYGPLSNFSSSLPGACQGSSISFTDKSSSDNIHKIVKWSWNYGDNIDHVYSQNSTFSHIYPDTGYYSVRLTVTDSYGCSDSSRKNNYVYISHPYASYTILDSIACPGKQVSFQNKSTGKSLDYLWKFGDGAQSNLQNPSYTYKKSGVYYPVLFITDINGCKDSARLKSLEISQPFAAFSMSDSTSTCPPLEINFTNKSSDFTSVRWDFGDGSPSILPSPTHVYTYPGVYQVKLTVKGYGACDNSATRSVTIKGPTGEMAYDALPVCYPDTIKFSAVANNTVLYTWDFSDGNTMSTKADNILYSYKAGHYLPKLILQDASGCKVSIKGKDTVKVFDITADALAESSLACDSIPIKFSDLSTSEDNIIHHYWFFGDNTSSDQRVAMHSYKNPGVYDAYVITETKIGCRDTFHITTPVKVAASPQVTITGDSSACSMATVSFKGNLAEKDNSITWKWNLGNGETTSGDTIKTVYQTSGDYTVSLIASNSGGCADTASKKVIVHALPDVNAGDDASVCLGNTYQLKASGAQTYTWSGNGLSCTGCANPVIQPSTLSAYMLTGKDIFGCVANDSVNISVIAPFKMTTSPADTICIGQTAALSASGALSYQWYPPVFLNNDKSAQPLFTPTKDTSITYKVVGHSAQNCFTDTGFVAVKAYPIPKLNIAQDEIVLSAGSSVQLNTGSSPDITQWSWQPPQGLSNTTIANPVASPFQTTTYSCVASNGGSCVTRDEITVRVVCGHTNVFIPNTFSPNNDGMNDVFYIRGTGLFKIKSCLIFNRWGQIVFENYNAPPNNAGGGWNGTSNGKALSPDVYIYVIEVLCSNNTVIPYKGNITLIR